MMEGEIAAGLKDPTADREDELEVRCVTQSRGVHTNASAWSGATATDPASPVELNFIAARLLDAHGLVSIDREEEMPVVRGDNGVLNTGTGDLANGARKVIDDRVHYLASLMGEAAFPGVIDLLRLHNEDLRSLELLRQL